MSLSKKTTLVGIATLFVLSLAVVPLAVAAGPLEPRGLWHFDNAVTDPYTGITTTPDSGPNGNNGTVHGATWNQGKLSRFHSGFIFDGVNNYIEVADTDNSLDVDQITVEAWIWFSSVPSGARNIVRKGHFSDRSYGLDISAVNAGKIRGFVNRGTAGGGTALIANGATTLTTDTWHHVAMTYDGTKVRVYVDGSQDGVSGEFITGIYDDNLSVRIGGQPSADPGGALAFAGLIDEVAIWGRGFSSDEVKARAEMGYLVSGGGAGSDQIKEQDFYGASIPDFVVFTSHFQTGSDVRISIATAESLTTIYSVSDEAARPKGTSVTVNQTGNNGKTWTGNVTTIDGAKAARLRVTLTGGNTFAVNVELP